MRILFVAMADSVHTARWISQIDDQGWDIHLYPSIDTGTAHSDLRNITIHHSFYAGTRSGSRTVRRCGLPVFSKIAVAIGSGVLRRMMPSYRMQQLRRLIKRLRPDIIHSMEIQSAGYLTLEVRKQHVGRFPPWIVTNWGSDIYLYGRLAEHVDKVKEVLGACDYYSCECHRDVHLAHQMGLRGEVLPVLPNAGGHDLARVAHFRQSGPTSSRRLILLKGYQGWAGRALAGLRAIALCSNELKDYRIAIFLPNPDVDMADIKIAAELVSQTAGIPIDLIPFCSHDDMLRLYGRARVYIGLSISDAASTSLLDAIVMGTFPIQSCTACADEWIVDGKSGLIVPPEDPETIAIAIRRAIADDQLVDGAAEINGQVARERLDQSVIRPQVVTIYKKVAGQI